MENKFDWWTALKNRLPGSGEKKKFELANLSKNAQRLYALLSRDEWKEREMLDRPRPILMDEFMLHLDDEEGGNTYGVVVERKKDGGRPQGIEVRVHSSGDISKTELGMWKMRFDDNDNKISVGVASLEGPFFLSDLEKNAGISKEGHPLARIVFSDWWVSRTVVEALFDKSIPNAPYISERMEGDDELRCIQKLGEAVSRLTTLFENKISK